MFGIIAIIFFGSMIISTAMERRGYDSTQSLLACFVYAAAVIGIATHAGVITP